MQRNDKKYCINIINNFLEIEHQKENYDFLEDFNFGRLLQAKKYNNQNLYAKFRANYDEDNFHIVKCIYYLIWNKTLPMMSSFNEMEDFYGGDVISRIKDSIYYLTLGNFMLLPKKSSGNTTLNRYKYCCFRDNMFQMSKKFEDMFHFYQKGYWTNKNQYNETWGNLVNANHFYFNYIKNYDNFLKINFLEEYNNSVNDIENIIQNRAKKMIKTLKEVILEKQHL